jgi:hypothetical protein
MLENAGHLPFEDPGLHQMIDAMHVFVTENGAAERSGNRSSTGKFDHRD